MFPQNNLVCDILIKILNMLNSFKEHKIYINMLNRILDLALPK